MNDNYVKFIFKIQVLHICHKLNGDSVYTVSAYKIYSFFLHIYRIKLLYTISVKFFYTNSCICMSHVQKLNFKFNIKLHDIHPIPLVYTLTMHKKIYSYIGFISNYPSI